LFAIFTRVESLGNESSVLVRITFTSGIFSPIYAASLFDTANVMSFSVEEYLPVPKLPGSFPPWPASITTTIVGLMGVKAAIAKTATIANARAAGLSSFECCFRCFMAYPEIKGNTRGYRLGMFFLFLILVLKNETLLGQDESMTYSASDSIVMIVDSNLVLLFGEVVIKSGDVELTADRVVYRFTGKLDRSTSF